MMAEKTALTAAEKLWQQHPERRKFLFSTALRIRPIMPKDNLLWYVDARNPTDQSYSWAPDYQEPVIPGSLEPIVDITTKHTWAFYGFFKPTAGEVIAQIPEEHFLECVGFQIIEHPKTAEDLNKHRVELNEGYHVATTRLFKKAARF
jgi:hypothetical protein